MGRRVKRRKFLARSAKAGLRLPYRVYRTVCLVSMAQRKAGLRRDERVRLVARAAPLLRDLPGVRHIEAVVFDGWRDDSGAFRDAPWKPNGALIFAESKDPVRLRRVVRRIYETARGLDQEMLIMEPLGDLDSW